MPSDHFLSLKIGAVGRVNNPNKGDWGHDYRLISKKILATTPPQEVVALESIDRHPHNPRIAYSEAPQIPAEWFEIPKPPEAPKPPTKHATTAQPAALG